MKIFKNKREILIITALLILINIFNGCVASSSYYSGKTLEPAKVAVTFSADDIALKSNDGSVDISKNLPFAPSVGIGVGLPFQLETGLRWYPPRFVELSLRDQVTPRIFDVIDASIDFNYAGLVGYYSYIKYGATVSKDIFGFEPFAHYYFYHSIGNIKSAGFGDFDGFINNVSKEFINSSHTVGFGIGVPFRKIKIFPEVDYQYLNNDLSNGIWHFGVGIRMYAN